MNICLCGTQEGYPHDPTCPFPYYGGNDWGLKWQAAKEIKILHLDRASALSKIEHLQQAMIEARDLARTELAPDELGMTQSQWLDYKLSKVAWILTDALDRNPPEKNPTQGLPH